MPLKSGEPTNEKSRLAFVNPEQLEEQHSMVIEANGEAVRLNLKKNTSGKVTAPILIRQSEKK